MSILWVTAQRDQPSSGDKPLGLHSPAGAEREFPSSGVFRFRLQLWQDAPPSGGAYHVKAIVSRPLSRRDSNAALTNL